MQNNDQQIQRRPVFKTRDYSKFKFLENGQNRAVNPTHIKKLKDDLIKENFLVDNPIKVNKEFFILDGQNRAMAAREAQVDIYYEFDNKDMGAIIKANAGTLPWRIKDYLEFYANQGKQLYQYLKDLKNKYPNLHFTILLELLASDSRDSMYTKFKNGDLNVSKGFDPDKIEFLLRKLKEVINYIKVTSTKELSFVDNMVFQGSLLSFFKKSEIDPDEFLRKIQWNLEKLRPCIKIIEYQEIFYYIYNYKKPKAKKC